MFGTLLIRFRGERKFRSHVDRTGTVPAAQPHGDCPRYPIPPNVFHAPRRETGKTTPLAYAMPSVARVPTLYAQGAAMPSGRLKLYHNAAFNVNTSPSLGPFSTLTSPRAIIVSSTTLRSSFLIPENRSRLRYESFPPREEMFLTIRFIYRSGDEGSEGCDF